MPPSPSPGAALILDLFRCWDTDQSGGISREELERVLAKVGVSAESVSEYFEGADVNKDGHLDYEEFAAWIFTGMSKSLQRLTRLDAVAAAKAAEAWEQERVSLALEMSAYSKKMVMSDAHYAIYRHDFNSVDTDGSGAIELAEVKTLLALQLGREPDDEEVDQFLCRLDANSDGRISLEEWIGALVGKEYSVSALTAAEINCRQSNLNYCDKDGHALSPGLIYAFTGDGCCSGDVCQYKGTSGTQAMLASKATHQVDGIGEFTGLNILTSETSKLRRATEKEAWVAAQKSALGMLKFYEEKREHQRADATRQAVEGYSKYTQQNPLALVADATSVAAPRIEDTFEVQPPEVVALVAASEARERERVALPIQMEAFSKRIIFSDAQFQLFQENFESVDVDRSGLVETSEIARLLTAFLAREPKTEEIQAYLEKFDANKDGFISLDEWISGILKKDWAVSCMEGPEGLRGNPEAVRHRRSQHNAPELLDAEGKPLVVGFIYEFLGGGCTGGDVCQLLGTVRHAGQLRLKAKSTNRVDGIGEFTGMMIVTAQPAKLKKSTEKEAFLVAQEMSFRALEHYKKEVSEGVKGAADRVDATVEVIRGYSEYTQVNPLLGSYKQRKRRKSV